MLTKYATLETLDAEIYTGSPLLKTAHRAVFEYDPKPGFLYVRSRAISSRTNDNFDTFPAEEIRQSYRSFIGKPVFVNHHNENHRRARGVIIDAVLHDDANADGTPDVWVEVLHEVDAVSFPKLAQAILNGEVDRTSMGCDVAYSLCSFCGNKAAVPTDYCKHIPRLKGKRIRRTTASGSTEDVLISEICHGLSFFENSLLVEEPADPTAFFLGVDDRGVRDVLSSGHIGGLVDDGRQHAARGIQHDLPRRWSTVPMSREHHRAGRHLSGVVAQASGTAQGRSVVRPLSFGNKRVAIVKHAYGETVAPPQVDTLRPDNCPICGDHNFNGDECAICGYVKPPDMYMDPDLDKAKEMDLRQDSGAAADVLDEVNPDALLECDVCGHTVPDADGVTPPDPATGAPAQPSPNPNAAPQQGVVPENPAQQPAPPNPPGSQLGDGPQKPPDPQGKPTAPAPDPNKDAQEPPAGAALPKHKDDDTNASGDGSKPDTDDSVEKDPTASQPEDDTSKPKDGDSKDGDNPFAKKDDDDSKPEDGAPEDSDKQPGTDDQAITEEPAHEGDPCPSCGQGTLNKKEADEYNADLKADEQEKKDGDLTPDNLADSGEEHFPGHDIASPDSQTSDGSDDKPGNPDKNSDDGGGKQDDDKKDDDAPPWAKRKQSTLWVDLPCSTSGISAKGVNSTMPEGVFSMAPRPLMQALAEQQAKIEDQDRKLAWCYQAIDRLATVAGLKVTADENNPAQPIPAPGSEAPVTTTEQARTPGARGDVAQIGGVPGATDVGADSTDTVDSIGGVKADTPYAVTENVTEPVAGTEDRRPLDEVRTVPEIQYGNPMKPDAAFPLQGEWAGRATVGSQARAFASLRLAKLRIEAGITDERDELVVAAAIGDNQNMTDESIASEIDTLGKVLQARPAQAQRTASRRPATATRSVPSMAPGGALGGGLTASVDDSEFLFD